MAPFSTHAFRDFPRARFLDLDEAAGAEQMNRPLAKVGLEIADGIRSVEAALARVESRRAVAVTGAAISTVAATLVAVSGPALASAMAVLGTSGGIWGMVNAVAEGRQLKAVQAARPWYYVWTLQRRAARGDAVSRSRRPRRFPKPVEHADGRRRMIEALDRDSPSSREVSSDNVSGQPVENIRDDHRTRPLTDGECIVLRFDRGDATPDVLGGFRAHVT